MLVAGLGAIGNAGALVLLTWAQARVDAITAGVIITLEPVFGAACAWVGFIHSNELRWIPTVGANGFNAAWGPVLGYLAMAALFVGMMYYTRNEPVQQFDTAAESAAD